MSKQMLYPFLPPFKWCTPVGPSVAHRHTRLTTLTVSLQLFSRVLPPPLISQNNAHTLLLWPNESVTKDGGGGESSHPFIPPYHLILSLLSPCNHLIAIRAQPHTQVFSWLIDTIGVSAKIWKKPPTWRAKFEILCCETSSECLQHLSACKWSSLVNTLQEYGSYLRTGVCHL